MVVPGNLADSTIGLILPVASKDELTKLPPRTTKGFGHENVGACLISREILIDALESAGASEAAKFFRKSDKIRYIPFRRGSYEPI